MICSFSGYIKRRFLLAIMTGTGRQVMRRKLFFWFGKGAEARYSGA
jgi:hypothetical protein